MTQVQTLHGTGQVRIGHDGLKHDRYVNRSGRAASVFDWSRVVGLTGAAMREAGPISVRFYDDHWSMINKRQFATRADAMIVIEQHLRGWCFGG